MIDNGFIQRSSFPLECVTLEKTWHCTDAEDCYLTQFITIIFVMINPVPVSIHQSSVIGPSEITINILSPRLLKFPCDIAALHIAAKKLFKTFGYFHILLY